jgi:hypothetical protein
MSLRNKVTELLNKGGHDIVNEFFHSEISDNITWDSDEVGDFRKTVSDQGVKFEHVDNYGGEGQGDEYWSVYKFSSGNEDVYVKFDGCYASYIGADYDQWFFVEPKQVMVTQFVRV